MTQEKKITFWGRELNEEELKNKRLSYSTMANTFDAILCNNIVDVDNSIFDNIHCGSLTHYYDGEDNELDFDEWEELDDDDKYERETEIYQYFLVSDDALWVLEKAKELVLYSELLDCYVWCVDFYGTSWSYVLTSLELTDDYTSLK